MLNRLSQSVFLLILLTQPNLRTKSTTRQPIPTLECTGRAWLGDSHEKSTTRNLGWTDDGILGWKEELFK